MSHHTPVNTVPTDGAGRMDPVPGVTLVFDVTDLARSTSFYSDLLGFRVVGTERAGMAYETKVLRSERHPAVALFLRKTFQRPVVGTMVGGVVQFGLHEPQLVARVKELEGKVTWILGYVEGARRASFLDPDGYIVELFC